MFQLASEDFTIEEVPVSCQDPEYSSDDIHLVRLTRNSSENS